MFFKICALSLRNAREEKARDSRIVTAAESAEKHKLQALPIIMAERRNVFVVTCQDNRRFATNSIHALHSPSEQISSTLHIKSRRAVPR